MDAPNPTSGALMPSILLIDDDIRLASMVADYLRDHHFEVFHAATGAAALAAVKRRSFDLILLDLMLPDADGLSLFRDLTAHHRATPVVMLTARGDPMDKVIGLEIGAEDYVAKPFEPRELVARIRVVLRRGAAQPSDKLRFGRLEIDRSSRIVRVGDEEKPLTSYQFDLLNAMAERAGRVLSREMLAELVRGAEEYDPAFDRSIDVHIARLRAVIEDDPKKPRRILTVRGAGYVFAKAQS
jgi:DNA-binding response OmpR family regulator